MKKLYAKVLQHPLLWIVTLVFLPGTLALTSEFTTDDYPILCQIRANPHNLNFLINGFELDITKNFHAVFGNLDQERGCILRYFRPLVIGLFILEYSIFESSAWGYHLTNLIFHLINCLLIYLILRNLVKNRFTCLLAVSLYTVCPQHFQSVHWVSGRTEVLVATCIFTAFLFHIYYRKSNNKKFVIGVFLLSLLGMGCKESIIVLPFLLLFYDLIVYPPNLRIEKPFTEANRSFPAIHYKHLVFYPLLILMFGVFTLYRLKGFADTSDLLPGMYFHSPKDSSFIIFCMSKVVYLYFTSMLAIPLSPLTADWIAETLLVALPLLVAMIAFIFWQLRVIASRNRPLFVFAIFWFFFNLLPSLPIMAQSYLLYSSSFGTALIVALLVQDLRSKARRKVIQWYPQKFRVGIALFVVNCFIFAVTAGLSRSSANYISTIGDTALKILPPSVISNNSTILLANILLGSYFYHQLLWKANLKDCKFEFLDCRLFFDGKPSFSWTSRGTLIVKYGRNRGWTERRVERTFLGIKKKAQEGKIYKRNGYSIIPLSVTKTGDIREMEIAFHPETEGKETSLLILHNGNSLTSLSPNITVTRQLN